MSADLVIPVGDLVGSPGKERWFSGRKPVRLRLGETTIDGPMTVEGRAVGLVDAIRAEFATSAPARFVCTRCLAVWEETVSTRAEQYFGIVADEDGYAIKDGHIDIVEPAQDELALALPAAPLCREGCLGLCPTCGSDLNTDPCDGHGDDPDSPFAVLKDLFDP
jgi:uncharacterized protein